VSARKRDANEPTLTLVCRCSGRLRIIQGVKRATEHGRLTFGLDYIAQIARTWIVRKVQAWRPRIYHRKATPATIAAIQAAAREQFAKGWTWTLMEGPYFRERVP
jgi:hypothetical protein